MKLLQPKRIRLHVTGILQLSGQLDHSLALVPLADAQQYLDMGDSVTGIALKMNDVFAANKLVRDAGEVTNSYIYIKSWIGKYGYMYRDIQMIRAIMYLAMVLVIGVACFNIVSTLVMAVKDKAPTSRCCVPWALKTALSAPSSSGTGCWPGCWAA